MKYIEEKLSKVPRARLGLRADLRIKFSLYRMIFWKKSENICSVIFAKQKLAVLVLIAFLLISVAAPTYAYESKQVTVGHFLYPIKLAIEKAEYKISDDKSETLLKFSIRRMEEADALASKTDQDQKISLLMNEAIVLRDRAIENSGQKEKDTIKQFQDKSHDVLSQVANKIGVESGDEVTDEVALTIENIKNIDLNKKFDNQNEKSNAVILKNKNTETIRSGNASSSQVIREKQEIRKEERVEIKTRTINEVDNRAVTEKKNKLDNAKNDVKKLETQLKQADYHSDDVDMLVNKLNNRIERVEKSADDIQVEKDIKSIKALTNNAELFIKKNQGDNLEKKSNKNLGDNNSNPKGNSKK